MTLAVLIQDYERRLGTITKELKYMVYVTSWDYRKAERLATKQGCYKTFLAELKQVQAQASEKEAQLLCEIIKGIRATDQQEGGMG